MVTGGAFNGVGCFARRAFAAALLAVALPASVAEASTRLCRQLEAQLAGLPSGGGGSSAQARRYDAAIVRQQQQIQVARGQARQAGCGRAIVGRAIAHCGSLNATLERMQRNLAELQRARGKMGGGNATRERQRIMAAIDVNGCRAPRRTLPEPVANEPRERERQAVIDGRTGLRTGNLSGNFRTMCVRTCDGYYFPISYSVSRAAFERDQNACASMCPGAQVELHYHRVPGEESEDMVSAVTGLPYRQMTNAFRYRRENASTPPGCGCDVAASTAARGFTVIGGDHGPGIVEEDAPAEEETAAIPLPAERPDPAEDPETLANREGGLDAQTLKRLSTPPRSAPAASEGGGERPVRVVGPTFLPDPEEAIDLRARDRNPAP